MKTLLIFSVVFFLMGCSGKNQPVDSSNSGKLKEALIIGSAEFPDPVLQRVRVLEREGVVKDVVVLESFPVQIHLKASQSIIDELTNISRVKGNLR